MVLILCLHGSLFSQQVMQPSRQNAYSAFNKGDYEKAFREFSILLQNYPKDPLYKYYCGICLVKAEKDPVKASDFLQASLKSQMEVRSVPTDAWFYLGRAQQLSGNYNEAIRSYSVYEKNAGKKASREMKVQDYIRECSEGRGMIEGQIYGDVIANAVTDTTPKDNPDSHQVVAEVNRISAVPRAETKRQILPASYDKSLTEAMDYQVKADSLNALAAGYRQEYNKLPAAQKQAAKSRIDETEALSVKYQKLADARFGKSDTSRITGNNRDIAENEKAISVGAVQDTGRKMVEKRPDSTGKTEQPAEPIAGTVDIFAIFSVANDPSLIKYLKIETDPVLPAGLIYRIQIGVYSKPLILSYFKGLVPVSGFKIPSTTSTRYYAGLFRRNTDAAKALLRVRQAGFRDAFVVAALDGKQISLERAGMLEKEWGQKPLLTIQTSSDSKQGFKVAPTLVFRVEIARSLIPVSDATSEVFRNLAGNKGLSILMSTDGSFVYLIGKFITFESATEYAGLLKRNGYENARVAAYLGNMEIPVEKAKQLFEKAE